jgi:hypothetical protein
MNQNILSLPEYSAAIFVPRAESAPVLQKVHDLVGGKSVPKRTIAFSGERGTGKTWLLRHLVEEIQKISDVRVYFLDLKPDSTIEGIIKDFRNGVLGLETALGKTPAEMSRQVMQELRALLYKQVLVILVDQAYESDWKLLSELEEYLLGPLAVEPRVLIVMAGRGRAYPWKTPELRLYAEFRKLGPFPELAQTAEQLKKQVSPEAAARAEEIHKLSGGNPFANFYLGKGQSIDSVISYILDVIPAENRHKAREYLEALCVLQVFDEERIPTMLAAYYGNSSYLGWSYAPAREVRDLLVKAAFARWNEDQGGYMLDSQTRRLVENYLRTKQLEKWRVLHCAAYRLYRQWIEEYARAREHWQAQASYHAQHLREAGYDPDQCPELETTVPVAQQATVLTTV